MKALYKKGWTNDGLLGDVVESATDAELQPLVEVLVQPRAMPTSWLRSSVEYQRYGARASQYKPQIMAQFATYSRSIFPRASDYEDVLEGLAKVVKLPQTDLLAVESAIANGSFRHPILGNPKGALALLLFSIPAGAAGLFLEATWRTLIRAIGELHRLRASENNASPKSLSTAADKSLQPKSEDSRAVVLGNPRVRRELLDLTKQVRGVGVERYEMTVRKGTRLMKLDGGKVSNEMIRLDGKIKAKVGLAKISAGKGKAIAKAGYNVAGLVFEQAQLAELNRKIDGIVRTTDQILLHLNLREIGDVRAHGELIDELERFATADVEPTDGDLLHLEDAITKLDGILNKRRTEFQKKWQALQTIISAQCAEGASMREAKAAIKELLGSEPDEIVREAAVSLALSIYLQKAIHLRRYLMHSLRPDAAEAADMRHERLEERIQAFQTELGEVLNASGVSDEEVSTWMASWKEKIPLAWTRKKRAAILRNLDSLREAGDEYNALSGASNSDPELDFVVEVLPDGFSVNGNVVRSPLDDTLNTAEGRQAEDEEE